MTIKASGQIFISELRAEFGGSAPDTLSEYYRGGGLVPNIPANSAVPTSGVIKLSDFYGASAQDLVMNPISFNDIVSTEIGSTNTQTVSGISGPVSIFVEQISGNNFVNFNMYRNEIFAGESLVSYSNGDTIRIEVVSVDAASGTFVVRNVSDNNTLLDTVNYDIFQNDGPFPGP